MYECTCAAEEEQKGERATAVERTKCAVVTVVADCVDGPARAQVAHTELVHIPEHHLAAAAEGHTIPEVAHSEREDRSR